MATAASVPTPALWARVLRLLTCVGGVSGPALGAGGLAVAASRRSGVALGRTGASSDRELGRAGTVQREQPPPAPRPPWPLLSQTGAVQPHQGWTRGEAEREHLRGDGEF